MSRLAVIDLGSNTFRLVVFAAKDGWWKRTDEIYEPVRIGEGLVNTNELGDEPIRRALAAIDVFSHFTRASGLSHRTVDAVATSAIRDAANADAFLKRVRKRTDLNIRVLSREEEAYYGYLAAVNSTTLSDGCVLDLGGGSMQLVRVTSRLATESGSWRMGAVRMTERFLAGPDPQSRRALDKLRAHAAEQLQRAPWLPRCGQRLVAIGGTVRNLAAAAQRAAGAPSFGVQGFQITSAALDDLIERLAALPAAERGTVPGIKPARGDLILAGAVVVRCVMEAGGFEVIQTTEAGLREGVFFERHLKGEEPPLFDDVRRSSVLNLAAQYRVDPTHTAHVAKLALALFDDLGAAGLHPADPVERELLWAASTLHDIGMSIDYDDHHRHSRYLILNGGMPGFAPNEVAVIAQAARYHRKGIPAPGVFAPLFAKGDAQRLDRLATLLRLAEDLERSRDQAIREVRVDVSAKDARLELIADGEIAVPRWAAAREVEIFERAFGRRLVVS